MSHILRRRRSGVAPVPCSGLPPGVMLFLWDAWLRERARLLAQISQGKEDLAALQRLHFQTAWRWTQRPLAEVIDASPPAAMVEEDDADCGFFIHPSRSGWGS